MKKNQLTKIISAVVLLALLCATVVGAYLGIMGRNTQYVTIQENGQSVERALYRQVAFIPNTINTTWQEAIRPSAALGGGYSYTLTADQAAMSDKDFSKALKEAAKVVQARAALISGSVSVKTEGKNLVVTTADSSYNELMESLLVTPGAITFAFYDSENGAFTDAGVTTAIIKQAYYYAEDSTYQVQLALTSKGEKAVSELFATHPYEYLYLLEDGQAVAAWMVTTNITNSAISFDAQDWASAFIVTDCLRAGALNVTLSMTDAGTAPASMAGFMDGAILGFAAALLLVCVYLIARNRLGGVLGAFTLVAQLVVSCLLTALIAVSANWIMSTTSFLLLLVAEALFVAGLVMLLSAMGKNIRAGRGASAALGTAYQTHSKVLLILYGAMLALGLVLMFAFQSQLAGVLGRILALNALVEAAMLFVFLRVVFACAFQTIGSKAALYK